MLFALGCAVGALTMGVIALYDLHCERQYRNVLEAALEQTTALYALKGGK